MSRVGSCLGALLAGAVCGLAGAAFSAPAGEAMVRVYEVSAFEGQSGYLVAFLLMPLGFLVGLVTGIVVMRVERPAGAAAIARQQGRAVLVTCGVLTVGYAFAWLVA